MKKLSYGIQISYDYCKRNLINKDGSEFIDNLISLRNDNEIGKPGYSAGFSASMQINERSAWRQESNTPIRVFKPK